MKHDNYEARFGRYFNFEKNFWDAPRRLGFLDLYQIGELCCEPGYEVKTHPQTVYEITYVISGSGTSTIDGEVVPLRAGDVLINAPGHQHALQADEQDILRYNFMGFCFNEQADERYRSLIEQYRFPWRLSATGGEILLPFMRCMDELYSQGEYSHDLLRNYCEQIVILAVRQWLNVKTGDSYSAGRASAAASVYRVIRYVEDNLYQLGSIQDIADRLGYSYTYISHLFRERTGTTLQNYIAYKKIENAVQLLRYGGLSSTQIASMLGYESVQSFSKSFRRVMGVTPTHYLAGIQETLRESPAEQIQHTEE